MGERKSVKEILARGIQSDTAEQTTEGDIAKWLAPDDLGAGVFLATMKVGQAMGESAGLSAKADKEQTFIAEYEPAVLATVLALKQQLLSIAAIIDTRQGALIEAKLPVDSYSLGGDLTLEIIDQGTQQLIKGKTRIGGQMFAWGKGTRTLNKLFERIAYYLKII